jgi:hypothetical protein
MPPGFSRKFSYTDIKRNIILHSHSEISRARREDGKLTIVATVAAGVNQGQQMLVVTPREEFAKAHHELAQLPQHELRGVLTSVKKAIRAASSQHPTTLSANGHQDLMCDLVLLMAAKCLIGDIACKNSALSDLRIAVEPDVSLPWDRRGLLSPAVESTLHPDVRPASG